MTDDAPSNAPSSISVILLLLRLLWETGACQRRRFKRTASERSSSKVKQEFHLHFLQLGKALKNSCRLQSGDVIVVEAAAERKVETFETIETNKSI